MDPINNPFSPGAGSPPPALVGREMILRQGHILFERVKQGRSEKSMLLTGLRGVGKTVLLNELERLAVRADYCSVLMEARENRGLGVMLVPPLKQVLYRLDRLAGTGNKVRRGLAVLASFVGAIKLKLSDVEFGLDIEPEKGSADSGDLESDLTGVFIAVAEAAKEKQVGIAILIDEIQYLSIKEMSALIIALHRIQQLQLPLALIGAGLPVLPALVGESKTYAERLFMFPVVGPLSKENVDRALQNPVKESGVRFTEAALNEIFKQTEGYPYFVQEWGYQAWNHAARSPISEKTISESTPDVMRRLDENFFRVRFDRLTPSECNFLNAMAQLGEGPKRTADIVKKMELETAQISPVRAKLIKKGMIYSPAYGEIDFSVPLFGDFIKRAMRAERKL